MLHPNLRRPEPAVAQSGLVKPLSPQPAPHAKGTVGPHIIYFQDVQAWGPISSPGKDHAQFQDPTGGDPLAHIPVVAQDIAPLKRATVDVRKHRSGDRG